VDYDVDKTAPKQSPPIVVMSLNMRTIMNQAKNVNEIVAISALIYSKGDIIAVDY
jgi:DNA polymerase alpha subunit A